MITDRLCSELKNLRKYKYSYTEIKIDLLEGISLKSCLIYHNKKEH